jgi:hypothetical protein
MSSQPGEGDKLSALHAPDTDDDDGCEEQGKGVGAACPKIDQDGMRKKKLRRDGEALNLSQQQREERQTVIAIIRQIEEMEYKEQAGKGGAWSTGLEGRVGHESGKVGGKRRFRVAHTGWGETAEEGLRGEGREARSSKTRGRKRPSTSRKGFKARRERRLWRRESVLCPKEPARQGRHRVVREWVGRGQEEAL